VDGTWGRAGAGSAAPDVETAARTPIASSWLAAAGCVVAGFTVLRLCFLGRSGLGLDFEEAQYWLWAQTPAWGYWSKPPMVAWLIAATTGIWGDTEPAIRLASPILHGATALAIGALGTTVAGPAVGFWSAVFYVTLPGVALSSILMTTDVPLMLFWTLTLLAFARLLETDRWPWAAACGIALGAGVLSKYTMLLFVPSAMIYLALSGRRLRLRRVMLAGAIVALVVSPNVAWNLFHQLGTVRHALSRAQPGVSSFWPGEPLQFLLMQFVVFGPGPCGWLFARELRFWRPPADDRRLFLGAFTVPPLAVALIISVVARANGNWAAPAYAAGTVLVVWQCLRAGGVRLLMPGLSINVTLGLLLYAGLAALPALPLPGGQVVPVRARLRGWDELGRRVAARASALGDATVLADLRELLAVAAYYGRVPAARLVEWNPSGVSHSHFELHARLTSGDPGPFLFVSYRENPSGVLRHFEDAELVERVVVPLAPGLDRTHWLFALRGFRGYQGRRRPETPSGPRTRRQRPSFPSAAARP
jgi:hypothetical protein